MRAGGLRKYCIEIQSATETKNRLGEIDQVWETVIRTKADIITKSGARINDVYELAPTYSVEIRIRAFHKVDEKMQVIFNEKRYRILAIYPTTEKAMKTLICEMINE